MKFGELYDRMVELDPDDELDEFPVSVLMPDGTEVAISEVKNGGDTVVIVTDNEGT